MLPYTIDDPITEPLASSVEVTIDFGDERRWLFFVTPDLLAAVGDRIDGTDVRVHFGERHMIVVSRISEQVIDAVLRELGGAGELKDRTLPLR